MACISQIFLSLINNKGRNMKSGEGTGRLLETAPPLFVSLLSLTSALQNDKEKRVPITK